MGEGLASLSKLLSFVLRHKPDAVGIELDPAGWTDVEVLLQRLTEHGRKVDRQLLERLVRESDKQRFSLSADGTRIRASQGHSAQVDLGLPPAVPPPHLYHGTATRFAASIRESGLKAGKRTHVHLSDNAETAQKVGARHGKPLILVIDSARMHREGYLFNVSENGVWLVSAIPPGYIRFRDHES